MIIPLQIRHNSTPKGKAAAWFLHGNSPERWLKELARSGLATSDTRLYVVPVSINDRTPAGLLVAPDHPAELAQPPAGIPCSIIADRLFLPLESTLFPPPTDSEVRALCRWPVTFVHPVFGFSGFGEESTLRTWDLLDLPMEHAGDWNLARPGAPSMAGLDEIILAEPPSQKDIFGGAEEEIGKEPLTDLPPAPEEPSEGAFGKASRGLGWAFAERLAETIGRIPHTGGRRTWLNDLEDWAHRKMGEITQSLDQVRNKELHRLLSMFENDPDAALRHAIPMNDFGHRGMAPPTNRLGQRSTDFDLKRLGGGAADHWDASPQVQETLRQRYREAADRELRLGRYRRAAYIYAELLGDLVSAANALKQGGHYREAAVIYEKHLNAPVDAAHCFAEAGLLPEAIERYKKLDRWLEVADLEERRGNPKAAAAAVRRVVEKRIERDDILGAAALVEGRLKAEDEALKLLLSAWPNSGQAAQCIGKAFGLMGRSGRHDEALERMTRFTRERVPRPLVVSLLTALGECVREYPHDIVRHKAADFSRVLVARQLAHGDLPDSDQSYLMQLLTQLAPDDRLLARDANRHLARSREHAMRRNLLKPAPLRNKKPTLLREIRLPKRIAWLSLRNECHWFYAAGRTRDGLSLIRGVWDGGTQSVHWPSPSKGTMRDLVIEPTRQLGRSVAVAASNAPPFPQKPFPSSDRFFNKQCLAGTPDWMTPQHWPVAYGEQIVWTAHLAAGRAVVSSHDPDGSLRRTHDLTEELLTGAVREYRSIPSLAAVGTRQVAIGLGDRLVVTRGSASPLMLELPGQVMSLVPTLPHTRPGVAIMLDSGAVMHWGGTPGLIELERDILSPCGAFVPGGPMVLASKAGLILLETDASGVKGITRMQIPDETPVGVSATNNAGEFAVLVHSGRILVYRIQN